MESILTLVTSHVKPPHIATKTKITDFLLLSGEEQKHTVPVLVKLGLTQSGLIDTVVCAMTIIKHLTLRSTIMSIPMPTALTRQTHMVFIGTEHS